MAPQFLVFQPTKLKFLYCAPTSVNHDIPSISSVVMSNFGSEKADCDTSSTNLLGLWAEACSQIPDNVGWVPDKLWIDGDKTVLLLELQAGQLRAVFDGPFCEGIGTACVQLHSEFRQDTIGALCRTPA